MEPSGLTTIKVPYPHQKDLHLKITSPVSTLIIAPGIGNAWVNGRYNDPKEVAPLCIEQSGSLTHIIAVGAFAYRTPPKYLPEMRITFGRTRPFSLALDLGDRNSHFDFGGIPLTSLEIKYGLGDQVMDFSYPVPHTIERIKLDADYGTIRIKHLDNANVANIRLNGGGTKYCLQFAGELKQNTSVHLGMNVAGFEIEIPKGLATKISTSYPPSNFQGEGFSFHEKAYWNEAARNNLEPLLRIHSSAESGTIKVRTNPAIPE